MNIVILSNVFFPVTNGVVHSIHLLSKGLSNLGKQVSVIFSEHPNFTHEIVQRYEINYNLLKLGSIYFPKIDYCIPNPFTIFDQINRLEIYPDIIQINHPFIIYKISKVLKKFNPKSKVIFVYHTQYDQYYHYFKLVPRFIYEKFLYNHLNEVFKFVDLVIFPSQSMKNDLENRFPSFSNKFIFISNPVDLEHIQNVNWYKVKDLREKYNIQGKFVLGFVGRMEKEKNIYKLIELFKELLDFVGKEKENIRLLLVGSGSELDNLRNYSKFLNLQEYVIFTDKVSYSDIPNYYKLIDVFVTLSLTEVKPLAYLESLSASVPIVSLKTFGADDLIIDDYNGYLIEFNENYKRKFINLIYELYKNFDLLNKLKRNSYNSSLQYNYLNIAQKYLSVYESIKN